MLSKSPRPWRSIAGASVFLLSWLTLGACESTPEGGGASVACALSDTQRCACGEREGTTVCGASGSWGECSCPVQETSSSNSSDAAVSSGPPAVRSMDGGRPSTSTIDGSRPEGGPRQDAASAPLVPREGDLPCDVRELLAKRCWECHGKERQFGAPMSLTSWDELQRVAPAKPEQTMAELVLVRVKDASDPMPPAPHERLSAAEVSVLTSWVEAGAPKSASGCDAGVTPSGPTIKPPKVPKPADCDQTFEVRAHGKATPNDSSKFAIPPKFNDRDYQCFYFDAPYADDSALFWYEPIIDNAAHLHHWILYATANKLHEDGTFGPCNAGEPGSTFVAGWGPGTDNVMLQPDVGLRLNSGPSAGLVLELHYFNDSDSAPEDASGVRFCTGRSDKRAHMAAIHATGTEGICLEPGANKDVAGTCKPRADLGDIHITGLWPHMHKRATRMLINIKRADGTTTVLHDAPFDFNAQLYHVKNDVIVHPGDSLETRCFYENDTNKRVGFGEGTEDEMCYGFITAWPVGSIAPPPDPLSELRSDLTNRCIDLLSVLGSCNGLADAL